MREQHDLKAAFSGYLDVLAPLTPSIAAGLRPGVSPAELDAAEQAIGRGLGDALRLLYSWHDGSEESAPSLFPHYAFSPLAQLVAEWRIWEELHEGMFDPDGYLFDMEEKSCDPEGPAKGDKWVRLDWLPFGADGAGDSLCVDLDPAPGGAVGQIVTLLHDDSPREVLAPSLAAYFELLSGQIGDGALVWRRFDWGSTLIYRDEIDLE